MFKSWRALLDTTLNHPILSKNSMYEQLVNYLAILVNAFRIKVVIKMQKKKIVAIYQS